MPRMTKKQFREESRSSGSGNFFNIKKEGSSIGWIHPAIGFYDRVQHATLAWNADDEKGTLKYRGFNCGGKACALCTLKDWAKKMISEDSSIVDDVVLSAKKGKTDIDISMSDLAGDGDWKTKITDTKKGYVICWIPHNEIENDSPYKILDMVPGLFFSIQQIIQSRIDDEGEKFGDPLMSPWAMKLVYNKDAKNPADYYKAEAVSERSFPYDEIVEEILDSEPSKEDVDLDRLTAESYYGDQLEALTLAWYDDAPFSFDDFVEFFENNTQTKDRIAADKLKDESTENTKKDTKKSKNTKKSSKNTKKSSKNTKDDSRTCDECGCEVGDAKFCPECGSSVRSSKVASKSSKSSSKNKGVKCDDCGHVGTPTKHGRCEECGCTLDIDDDDVPY